MLNQDLVSGGCEDTGRPLVVENIESRAQVMQSPSNGEQRTGRKWQIPVGAAREGKGGQKGGQEGALEGAAFASTGRQLTQVRVMAEAPVEMYNHGKGGSGEGGGRVSIEDLVLCRLALGESHL